MEPDRAGLELAEAYWLVEPRAGVGAPADCSGHCPRKMELHAYSDFDHILLQRMAVVEPWSAAGEYWSSQKMIDRRTQEVAEWTTLALVHP